MQRRYGNCQLRVLGWVLAGWTFYLTVPSSGAAPQGAAILEADNAVIRLYPQGQSQAEAVLRIGKVRRGFERRGFFRLGIMPQYLVRDVAIEFQESQTLRATLGRSARALSELGNTDKVQLENVTVWFPGEAKPRLRADTVKFGLRGCLELSGNLQFTFAGESLRPQKAQLKVTGAEAGRLVLFLPNQVITTDLLYPVPQKRPVHPTPATP